MEFLRHKLTIALLFIALALGAFPTVSVAQNFAFSPTEFNLEASEALSDLKADSEFDFASVEANV